jgi:hypothetical protein
MNNQISADHDDHRMNDDDSVITSYLVKPLVIFKDNRSFYVEFYQFCVQFLRELKELENIKDSNQFEMVQTIIDYDQDQEKEPEEEGERRKQVVRETYVEKERSEEKVEEKTDSSLSGGESFTVYLYL